MPCVQQTVGVTTNSYGKLVYVPNKPAHVLYKGLHSYYGPQRFTTYGEAENSMLFESIKMDEHRDDHNGGVYCDIPLPYTVQGIRTMGEYSNTFNMVKSRLLKKASDSSSEMGQTIAEAIAGYSAMRSQLLSGLRFVISLVTNRYRKLNYKQIKMYERQKNRVLRNRHHAAFREALNLWHKTPRKERGPRPVYVKLPWVRLTPDEKEAFRNVVDVPVKGVVSSTYLTYNWFLKPTIEAFNDFLKIFNSFGNIHYTVRTGDNGSRLWSFTGGIYKYNIVNVMRMRAYITVTPHKAFMNYMGVDVPMNMWQIATLSFVVDWFLKISRAVRQLTFDYSTLSEVWLTNRQYAETRHDMSAYPRFPIKYNYVWEDVKTGAKYENPINKGIAGKSLGHYTRNSYLINRDRIELTRWTDFGIAQLNGFKSLLEQDRNDKASMLVSMTLLLSNWRNKL